MNAATVTPAQGLAPLPSPEPATTNAGSPEPAVAFAAIMGDASTPDPRDDVETDPSSKDETSDKQESSGAQTDVSAVVNPMMLLMLAPPQERTVDTEKAAEQCDQPAKTTISTDSPEGVDLCAATPRSSTAIPPKLAASNPESQESVSQQADLVAPQPPAVQDGTSPTSDSTTAEAPEPRPSLLASDAESASEEDNKETRKSDSAARVPTAARAQTPQTERRPSLEASSSGERGTSAASTDSEVKTSQKQDEFAAGERKNLPEVASAAVQAEAEPNPVLERPARKSSTDNVVGRSSLAEVPPAAVVSVGGSPLGEAVGGLTEATRAPSSVEPVAEVLSQQIIEHAVTLRRSSTDSVDVTLRPGGDTQIHLQLSTGNDGIQATLRVESGDALMLHAHWGELQQSLAQQGVRLSSEPALTPLQTTSNPASTSSSSSNEREASKRGLPHNAEFDQTPDGGLSRLTSPTSPAPTATAHSRRWEMWA